MLKTEILHIDETVRQEVVKELMDRLQKDYIFPEIGMSMAIELDSKLKNGEYDSYNDADAFSKALTSDLQSLSKDRHVKVMFKVEENTVEKEASERDIREEFHRKAKVNNYGFYKVERLQGNVGYIDLRNFIDPIVAGETAINAMNFIANTDALIFDLRKNGGGSPAMIALITSYLFDAPTHLNNFYRRPEDRTIQSWTLPFVPGKRYLDKPVYVLTSNYTFSAAEEFTYNLIQLKRATVVGEVTGGGAHPGHIQQITKNFRVFIPTGRAINPITNTNWEGTGVTPDIVIAKEEAFNFAYKDALQHVQSIYQDNAEYTFLLEEVNEKLLEMDQK